MEEDRVRMEGSRLAMAVAAFSRAKEPKEKKPERLDLLEGEDIDGVDWRCLKLLVLVVLVELEVPVPVEERLWSWNEGEEGEGDEVEEDVEAGLIPWKLEEAAVVVVVVLLVVISGEQSTASEALISGDLAGATAVEVGCSGAAGCARREVLEEGCEEDGEASEVECVEAI